MDDEIDWTAYSDEAYWEAVEEDGECWNCGAPWSADCGCTL